MQEHDTEWFINWFDSPYYPILYKHRDEKEAQAFILKLLNTLQPASYAHLIDLACGRGRHAKFLAQQGFFVSGLDISPQSIADAKQWESDKLKFYIHDMREPLPIHNVQVVFNLFTSFGYFEDTTDNAKVLQNIYQALTPDGTLVLDYLNATHSISKLVPKEEKEIQGIQFNIKRYVDNHTIFKEIHIQDKNQSYSFKESVQALELHHFQQLLDEAGFRIEKTWGDYMANPFAEESPRLIIFARNA